jgi:hypothetical protein
MERDVNMCGVAQCNAFPLIDSPSYEEPLIGSEEFN